MLLNVFGIIASKRVDRDLVLVAQLFNKAPTLKALAPTETVPAFAAAQL
ncbi:MAG: hypothetical protein ABI693_20665 [Bryobacteraceae bacterium]